MIAPPPSTSMLAGWPPSMASATAPARSLASNGSSATVLVRASIGSDSTGPVTPSRLNADSAFGLA